MVNGPVSTGLAFFENYLT